MALDSHIEWTQSTWNPVTGCTKVSAGCANCYAERMAKRLKAMGNPRYVNGFGLTLHYDLTSLPSSWARPKTIFVNSMSDLFHPNVPIEFIAQVFAEMNRCRQHTFQILTKRPEIAAGCADRLLWSENIWMGTTVEDAMAKQRLEHLRLIPAAVRFVSAEPLLSSLGRLDLQGIDWVIVGGESGPHARKMDASWVRDIQEDCARQKVHFFFKQWGGHNKKAAGRILDGRTWDEMPKQINGEQSHERQTSDNVARRRAYARQA